VLAVLEGTTAEAVAPPYKALMRRSAALSPKRKVLRDERPVKRVRQQLCGIEGRRRQHNSVVDSTKSSWTLGPPSETQRSWRWKNEAGYTMWRL